MPDGLDGQVLALRPLVRGVSAVGVADDFPGLDAIECLQVRGDLLEDGEAARAVHLADVRRYDDAVFPAQGQCTFHVSADREDRLRLPPGQRQFGGRTAAPEPQWTHATAYSAKHGIVRRPYDRPVMVQECVRDRLQALSGLLVRGQHGFAADVARCCDQWLVERFEQQLV